MLYFFNYPPAPSPDVAKPTTPAAVPRSGKRKRSIKKHHTGDLPDTRRAKSLRASAAPCGEELWALVPHPGAVAHHTQTEAAQRHPTPPPPTCSALQAILALIDAAQGEARGFHCKRCGEARDISVVTRQTRSVDEGMTSVYMCGQCSQRWKV